MKFYGLIGEKLTHSLSPNLHKTIYQRTGINAAYKTFPCSGDKIPELIESLKLLSISGANVTIPYKETVMPFLDHIDSNAKKLGVVNTILNENGYLKGFNTDYEGFGVLFERRGWQLSNKSVTVLGTGGSSKMVVQYLKDHGVSSITLISRTPKDNPLTGLVTYATYEELPAIKGDYLINTTPVGMYPNGGVSPITDEIAQHFGVFIDLIYNPLETVFLKQARSLGKPAVNGLEMLIGQAIKSIEIWEDRTFSPALIDELIQDFNQWKEM